MGPGSCLERASCSLVCLVGDTIQARAASKPLSLQVQESDVRTQLSRASAACMSEASSVPVRPAPRIPRVECTEATSAPRLRIVLERPRSPVECSEGRYCVNAAGYLYVLVLASVIKRPGVVLSLTY